MTEPNLELRIAVRQWFYVPMKQIFSQRLLVSSLSIFLTFVSQTALQAEDKRTDGKPGSEYGDFSSWDGEWRVGAQFGALLPTASSADASFAIGADLDYRPYEVFGFRTTYLQGLKSPRASVISIIISVYIYVIITIVIMN